MADQVVQLKCKCGATKGVECSGFGAYNVGEVRQKSEGWGWIPLEDGASLWTCPVCFKQAVALSRELVTLLGTGNFSIRYLAK